MVDRLNVSNSSFKSAGENVDSRETSDCESNGLISHPSLGESVIINIPSGTGVGPSARLPGPVRRHSSSDDADSEEILNDDGQWRGLGGIDTTLPELKLQKTCKRARRFANKKLGEESIQERVRCVALSRIVYGDCHWQLGKAYAKLAQAYLELRALAKQALMHSENARDILLAAEAAKSQNRQNYERSDVVPVIELTYYIMGVAQAELKRPQKAMQCLKKAELVSRERQTLDKAHTDSDIRIKILCSLGRVSQKMGKAGYALECYEKAVEVAQFDYGEEGVQMIPIYQGMGRAEQSQGDSVSRERALNMFLHAHKIAKTRYKEGSVEIADTAFSVALSYSNSETQECDEKAKGFLEECVGIYMEKLGPYDKKTVKAQDELCRLLIRVDDMEGAVSLLKAVTQAKYVVYGDPSEEAATCHQLLGSIRLKQGQMELALKSLCKCHSMLTAVLGKNHKKTKRIAETLEMVKRAPGARAFQSSQDKLKERPRFTQVVGRSRPVGYSAASSGD